MKIATRRLVALFSAILVATVVLANPPTLQSSTIEFQDLEQSGHDAYAARLDADGDLIDTTLSSYRVSGYRRAEI